MESSAAVPSLAVEPDKIAGTEWGTAYTPAYVSDRYRFPDE